MFFVSRPDPDWVVSTGFSVLQPHPNKVDPRYLYYCVFDKAFTEYLVSREKGAAYPAILPEDIANALIRLPPLSEQQVIAHILGTLDDHVREKGAECAGLRRCLQHLINQLVSGRWTTEEGKRWLDSVQPFVEALDDKIELNRQMSETLEQMARAIFKAWFVDFEPVRAKMEGRWRRGRGLWRSPARAR